MVLSISYAKYIDWYIFVRMEAPLLVSLLLLPASCSAGKGWPGRFVTLINSHPSFWTCETLEIWNPNPGCQAILKDGIFTLMPDMHIPQLRRCRVQLHSTLFGPCYNMMTGLQFLPGMRIQYKQWLPGWQPGPANVCSQASLQSTQLWSVRDRRWPKVKTIRLYCGFYLPPSSHLIY